MPLTADFKETILSRIKRDPAFGKALLSEAIDVLIAGEVDIAKSALRDYINGTMGFERLARRVRIPPKSLMRMFGPSGNPQAKNLFAVIAELQREAGIELRVEAAE